jgi:hypothetical protein
MVTMANQADACDGAFQRLRGIAAAFEVDTSDDDGRESLIRSVRLAGRCAIPMLVRQLGGACDRRRALARVLLCELGVDHRDRLVEALTAALHADATDSGKAAALGLLAELGAAEPTATFLDPRDAKRRSAAQLAAHLETRADIASAADLLVHELDGVDLIEVVEAMADTAPERTTALVDELGARLDLDADVRSQLRRIVAPLALARRSRASGQERAGAELRRGRPSCLALLVHPDGRRVVVISRRAGAAWRNFAALVGADGTLDDCLYEDETTPDVLERDVVGILVDQGYARRPATVADARTVVAAAAVRAATSARGLPSSYYLGRDLLGLGDTHLGQRARASALATLHGRAVDLLAAGDLARARPLLEHCARLDDADPDVAASLGSCLLAAGEVAAARIHLARAARLEPSWALHHWNHAAACHAAGDLAACWRALREYLVAADGTGGLGDAAHADRLAVAHRFVADFERAAHLAGRRLPARGRRRAKRV